MRLDEELRTMLAAQAERPTPPLLDVDSVLSLGKARRRRRIAVQVGATVAAVAVGVGMGAIALDRTERSAPAPGPAAPSSETRAAQPLPECAGADDRKDVGRAGCLEPGTYTFLPDVVPNPYVAQLTVATDRWDSGLVLHRIERSARTGTVMFNAYAPTALAGAEPCDADQTVPVPAQATAGDVAARLARLPQFTVVTGPTAVEAFGRHTVHLQIRTARVRCSDEYLARSKDPHAQYNLADFFGSRAWGDSDIDPGRPVLIDLWVLALGGHNIVVEARQEGNPTNQMIEELRQIGESLRFVRRE